MGIPQISIIDVVKFGRNKFNFKTQQKDCFVLTCRTEGESLFFFNNEEHLVKRGDILYIPSKSSYFQKSERETLVCFHLNITGRVSSKIKVFSPKDRDKICNLFLRAEALWKKKEPTCEFLCMSILYEILSEIQICTNEQSQNSIELLKTAVIYLNAHLCDTDLSLERVCKETHISRTYFNKLFYQNYGCTPTAYINEQRIERAKQLLISGSCTNEEIALLCGFNDVKYFYVIFKKLTKLTTKEYKREFEKLHKNHFVSSM